jgi:cysteine desulfurase
MGSRNAVYWDYNATTPLDGAVREAMAPCLDELYGNPSSVHQLGRAARVRLDEARERIAGVLGCQPSELIFTSGGTESVNLAILGAARSLKRRGQHLITSAIEHHAVLHCFEHLAQHEGFELTVLPVSSAGQVDPDDLRRALRRDTILVSVMAANNEVGTLQPLADLSALSREHGCVFHCDAVQWFGKMPFPGMHEFGCDLVSLCGHKFHGPRGSGLLYVKSPLQLRPLLLGGSQEDERRAGTENLAAILGLARAIELFVRPPVFPALELRRMTDRLIQALTSIPGVHFHGHERDRLANTVAISVIGTDGIALVAGLDLEGVCVSSGAACSAGSLKPSHVLQAMGVSPESASAMVRFSLGRGSTEAELEYVLQVVPRVVERIRSVTGS